jgi:hypothetical protein
MQKPNVVTRTLARPGFLEAVVGLSVLMALSGVLMPVVRQEVGESRSLQAQRDMQSIAEGLSSYSRDTRFLPTGVEGRTNVAWLFGPGHIPADHAFGSGGEARSLADVLLNPSMGGEHWAGPYARTGLHPDPWGNAYLVSVDGLVSPAQRAVILCAGPDGRIETAPDAVRPAGDDVLLSVD